MGHRRRFVLARLIPRRPMRRNRTPRNLDQPSMPRPKDLDPSEPIAYFGQERARARRARCQTCGEPIAKGDAIVRLDLAHTADAVVIHAACYAQSPWESNVRERYEKRAYQLSDFDPSRLPLFRRDCIAALHSARPPNLDEAMSVIAASTERDEPSSSHHAPAVLFHVLHLCGFADAILERFDEWPPHVRILASLHDDRRFQAAAARSLNAPGWPQALNGLRKARPSLADIDRADHVGAGSSVFRSDLSTAIARYGLDRDYALWWHGFREFTNVRWAQLVYFFLSHPEDLPRFASFRARRFDDWKGALSTERSAYIEPFYYRASMLSLARSQDAFEPLIDFWQAIERDITFYPSGSPDRFIKDTKIMVASALRSNPPALAVLTRLGEALPPSNADDSGDDE